MPQAVVADWPFIQALYLQGLPPKEITAKTGVKSSIISQHATRYGWKAAKTKTTQILEERLTISSPMLSDSVAKASVATRNALAISLKELSEHVASPKAKPRSLKQAVKLQAELEPAIRNAERIFGWSQQSSTTAFSSQVLSEAPPGEIESPTEKPAIDVQSSPLPE